jgi:DNA-binding IclR family transcriptional regulator
MGSRAVPVGLQTVAAAIDLLGCFADSEELGVSEVSRQLGIAKSTAHRLLYTLASRGIVEQNQRNSKYRLGLRLYELGNLALTRDVLRRHAKGALEALREAVGWTVQLSVASGVDTLVLERLQTVRSYHSLPEFQHRLPLHATSQGKALCAHNPMLAEQRVAAGLPALTEHTITTPAAFALELDKVRRQGFAITRGESFLDVAGIGVPIIDARGVAVAAISVIGGIDDIIPSAGRIGRISQTAAARISKGLRSGV